MIKNRAEVLVCGDSAYYQPKTQFEWPEFFVVQMVAIDVKFETGTITSL